MIKNEEEARSYVARRCDHQGMVRLERLAALLVAENARQNLVSASSLSEVWRRHIADSVQLLDHVPRETVTGGPWLDLGTGAGFPGIVIAVARPEIPVIVVESRKRRIEWLQTLVLELRLGNCRVAGMNLENVPSLPARVISARAFAPLDRLVASARRFSTSDTLWLLPKGRSAAQEVEKLPCEFAGVFHVEQSATDADSGIIVGRLSKGQRR